MDDTHHSVGNYTTYFNHVVGCRVDPLLWSPLKKIIIPRGFFIMESLKDTPKMTGMEIGIQNYPHKMDVKKQHKQGDEEIKNNKRKM